jgi:hypothetical protein
MANWRYVKGKDLQPKDGHACGKGFLIDAENQARLKWPRKVGLARSITSFFESSDWHR